VTDILQSAITIEDRDRMTGMIRRLRAAAMRISGAATLAVFSALVAALVPRLALADEEAPSAPAAQPPQSPSVAGETTEFTAKTSSRNTAWRAVPEVRLPTDSLILFDKPRFWDDSVSETWTLTDRTGKVICELPCASWVGSFSGYVLEGSAIRRSPWSFGPEHMTSTAHFVLPNPIGGDPHGEGFLARVTPRKGSPDSAIALGTVGGVFLAGVKSVARRVSDGQVLSVIKAPLARPTRATSIAERRRGE
jgi:hypothetical protein